MIQDEVSIEANETKASINEGGINALVEEYERISNESTKLSKEYDIY
jgi:hypothetical protein